MLVEKKGWGRGGEEYNISKFKLYLAAEQCTSEESKINSLISIF